MPPWCTVHNCFFIMKERGCYCQDCAVEAELSGIEAEVAKLGDDLDLRFKTCLDGLMKIARTLHHRNISTNSKVSHEVKELQSKLQEASKEVKEAYDSLRWIVKMMEKDADITTESFTKCIDVPVVGRALDGEQHIELDES